MIEENIWIAKGYVISSDIEISFNEFRTKTDKVHLEIINPIIKELQQKGIDFTWYSSRRKGNDSDTRSRSRIYINTTKNNEMIVLKIISQESKENNPIDDDKPNKERSNFHILQKASEIAFEILPEAIKSDRDSEKFLQDIDSIVEKNNEIMNQDGLHWLENNLGYSDALLIRRYYNKGLLLL